MSLYGIQKFFFDVNRNPEVQQVYLGGGVALDDLLTRYPLDQEESAAIREGDIGKLYVMGCNGQLLMHFAPLLDMPWAEYLEAMREGVREHGPVRAGVYAMTTGIDEKLIGI